MALEGGCKWIQLRMKDATDDEVRSVAAEIQPLCKQNEAIFLLDDRVELAPMPTVCISERTTCQLTRRAVCLEKSLSSEARLIPLRILSDWQARGPTT